MKRVLVSYEINIWWFNKSKFTTNFWNFGIEDVTLEMADNSDQESKRDMDMAMKRQKQQMQHWYVRPTTQYVQYKPQEIYELVDWNMLKARMFKWYKNTKIKFATDNAIKTLSRNLQAYIDVIIRKLVEKSRISNSTHHLIPRNAQPGSLGIFKYDLPGVTFTHETVFYTLCTDNPKKKIMSIQDEYNKRVESDRKRHEQMLQVKQTSKWIFLLNA